MWSRMKKHKVGHETVYQHQERMAKTVMAILEANENRYTPNRRSAVVLMQPQSGKTGVIIAIINAFILDCILYKKTFQVCVVTGLSQCDLTEQTRGRLRCKVTGRTRTGADLDILARQSELCIYNSDEHNEAGILCLNNTQVLRRVNLNRTDVDVRLWIGDEVHLGNVRGGNIDALLRHHGVKLNEQIHGWDNLTTVNHFVGVSATPSAHMIKSDNIISLEGDALFHTIYEQPPADYNSMAEMLANGRLRQTEARDGGDAFYDYVFQEFRTSCRRTGPGYLVLRAQGDNHTKLINYINRKGRNVECRQFDAQAGNLPELNPYLAERPMQPEIVLIRGSMRAGITLPEEHFIQGWVETESVNSDAPVQAGVGRACGYGRKKDTFPIYCDLAHVKLWVAAYAALATGKPLEIPSGNHNKRTKPGRQQLGIKEVLPMHRERKKDPAWLKYVAPHVGTAYRKQISHTADNVFNDVAGMLLEARHDSGSSVGVYVDGPTTDRAANKFIHSRLGKGIHRTRTEEDVWEWVARNRASYDELVRRHPDWAGKAVIFDAATLVPDADQTRDNLQKAKSALKNEQPLRPLH